VGLAAFADCIDGEAHVFRAHKAASQSATDATPALPWPTRLDMRRWRDLMAQYSPCGPCAEAEIEQE
jgi:hypothetical protein